MNFDRSPRLDSACGPQTLAEWYLSNRKKWIFGHTYRPVYDRSVAADQ
jgi:hypothetical protein